MMRSALFPRHFTLARAFSLSRTIRSIWGTIQIIERSTLEALIGRYFHFCINKVHEVGGRTAPPVTLLLFYSRCHRLWSVTGCFISDYFFYYYYFYFFISTTSIDIHCSSTYSKIKSQKSHTIFDFKSRDSTFYKAIEKRGDVSSMQLICMTKQKKKQILSQKQKGTRLK